jgi:hypothetical protein
MPGFPYLQPLKKWIVDEFKLREQTPEMESLKMPFVVLTSAARVSKSESYVDAVTGKGEIKYQGCIIANNIDPYQNYGLTKGSNTALGYDFTGQKIIVDNETDAKKPMPVITQVTMDTDGDNNALKKLQINIELFSLKQLEMFEIFFCRPGYNILCEFGNNYMLNHDRIDLYKKMKGLQNPNQQTSNSSPLSSVNNRTGKSVAAAFDVETLIVPKNNYKDFVETEYRKYFALNQDDLQTYHKKILESRGNYEIFAGKVTNFQIEVENGIYKVMLEISAGNTVTLAIPNNTISDAVKIGAKGEDGKPLTKEEIIRRAIQIDSGLLNLEISDDDIKTHTFNFVKPNDSQKDSHISDSKYVSLYFIIKYLGNFILQKTGLEGKSYEIQFQKVTYNKKEIDCIPCNSRKNIISSSQNVLFPGKLPTFKVNHDRNTKTDEILFDTKNLRDCKINGLEFNMDGNINLPKLKYNESTKKFETINDGNTITNTDTTVGNALNVFLYYNDVIEMWRKSTTRADFINGVLKMINDNMYGLTNLVVAPLHGDNGPVTIIDRKFSPVFDETINDIKNDKIYRFKLNSIDSIVKNFTMNLDLGNLVAGQSVFQTTSIIENILQQNTKTDGSIDYNNAITNVDSHNALHQIYQNGDGYYSMDAIEVENIKIGLKDRKAIDAKGKPLIDASKAVNAKEKKKRDADLALGDDPKEVTNPQKDAEAFIDSKVIRFKLPSATKNEILVLNDKDAVMKQLNRKIQKNSQALTSFNVSVTVNGITGISAGEYFRINGVPEIYNQNGVFQVTNVKHNLETQSGWITTIEAMWLIINLEQ